MPTPHSKPAVTSFTSSLSGGDWRRSSRKGQFRPEDAGGDAAGEPAIVDDDTGDIARAACPEDGADGGCPLHNFLVGGFKNALEGLLNVFDYLIDDVVGSDLHSLPLGGGLGAGPPCPR